MKSVGDQTSTLYVVGTPIGNLEDLSPRAARILEQVSLVASEDTRVTRRLLNHVGVRPRLLSFNEHNWRERLGAVFQALEQGDVALVTDAGMPGISDPGHELVAAAIDRGIRVESVPGPSAVTTALAMSGLPADSFIFLGFLPRRRRERQRCLGEVSNSSLTIVLFEAPHRMRATLEDVAEIFGDRLIAVCRELTKLHEEIFRGTAPDALAHFDSPRGEFVLVISGAEPDSDTELQQGAREEEILGFLAERRADGARSRDAIAETAGKYGVPKNIAYRLWLDTAPKSTGEKPTQ